MVLLAVVVVVAACGNDDEASEVAPTTTASVPTATTTTAPTTTLPTTSSSAAPDPSCSVSAPVGRSQGNLRFEELDRTYLLYVPPELPEGPHPLVFNFHGLNGSAELQMERSRIEGVADRNGFVVVAPQARPDTERWLVPGFESTALDSIRFFDALLEHVRAGLCVDPAAVFSTGFSYGGIMSSGLACHRPQVVAAVAPVSATVYKFEVCGGSPVPVIAFHGDSDHIVSYDGSPTVLPMVAFVGNIEANAASFASANGCDPDPELASPDETTEVRSWRCPPGREVELHTWLGALHDWMHGEATTETIWEFFEAHRMR